MRSKAVTITVAGMKFTADIAVSKSAAFPGKDMVEASDVMQLEQAAARWLIEHGVTSRGSIKVLRAAAGLTASQLGELLGTDRTRVSKWETGAAQPSVALWNTVAALALDAMDGRTTTLDRLRATQTEQPALGEIKLAVG